MNKTRKIKNKTRLKKKSKSNEKREGKNASIEKIIIDNGGVGCVTVKNSFEENFENYFKNKKRDKLKKNANNTIGKELISAFKKPIAPKDINPKDDFYTYVNYDWLKEKEKKHKKMKKYYTRVDSFRMIQEKVYYQLIDIIKA
jgi:hypothetical protein